MTRSIKWLGMRTQKVLKARTSILNLSLCENHFGQFSSKCSFVGQNFYTGNPRKSIKSSKDLDFGTLSTENLSQKISSSSWDPGSDDLGQKGLSLPYLWSHPQKPETQIFQIFFSMQIRRLVASFEGLNSSLAQHGLTTFDQRVILQNRVNLRATSNKRMYKKQIHNI